MNLSPVECLDAGAMSDSDRRRCAELNALVWPPKSGTEAEALRAQLASAPPPPRDWPPTQRPRIMVVRDGGVIFAKALATPRELRTARGPLVVLALAGVLSHPDYRKLGLGRAVVRAAFELVDRGEFPCSFFQTGVPDFYRKLGCRPVTNPLVNSLGIQPLRCPFWDATAMIYPATFDWPEGEIDTLGPGW